MARVHQAARVTRGRAVNGGRMPYFFAVLEDRLGLREAPSIKDTS